ncbi:Ig-like domain-containing protein [Microvirga sp. 0TCS3.31]
MKHAHSGARRSVGTVATLALIAGTTAVLASPAPAQAAATTVTNAELRWELNKESISGAYAPGTWNLFSAGRLGNPGAGSQTLTSTDQGATWSNGAAAGWRNTEGNVTVLDKQADGSYAPTTWLGTRQNAAGQSSNTSGTTSENLLSLRNGTGSVDPVTDTGTVQWEGDFTVVYYSGMSFFHVSDPELSVANGSGKLTATLSGYGSDMDDPSQWVELPATEVTLGDVTGVDLTATGLTVTPTYLGVTVTPPAGNPPQATGNPATAGSFPQSFVDFQGRVGTASYWYSSGGGADTRKPTTPLTVAWSEPGAARVSVSDTTLLPNGAQQVTVEGTGFDPALATGVRPPLAGRPSGAYIAFGRYADVWKQSAGAPSSARVNAGGAGLRWAVPQSDMETVGGAAAGAVELRPDGTFTATLTVDKAVVDARTGTGNYGIYTYPGSGAVQAAYETYTPITFAKASPTVSVTAGNATYGADVPVSVSVTGPSAPTGAVTLTDGPTTVGTATLVGGKASFTLSKPAAGTHQLEVSYAGDANTEAAGTSRALSVAKVVPSVGVTTAGGQDGAAVSVRVTVPADATGTVVLKEGASTLGTAAVAGGAASFTVSGLTAGEHALVASYTGDANHEAASGTTRTTVTAPTTGTVTDQPARGIAKVTWGTRPTPGKRGTVVVKVSELASGKAALVLRTAAGKKLKALSKRIKAGTVTVRLPRLARGRYTLVVKVPGNDAVARARATRTFRVK